MTYRLGLDNAVSRCAESLSSSVIASFARFQKTNSLQLCRKEEII